MLEFHDPQLQDKPWIDELVKRSGTRSADYSFTNIYAWRSTFANVVARWQDFLLMRLCYNGQCAYACPMGQGDFRQAVQVLLQDAAQQGKKLCMRGVTAQVLPLLQESFGDAFDLTPEPELFDYAYDLTRMCTLSGKKMHAKKNYVNRFQAENDWSFSPLTQNDVDACIAMNRQWVAMNTEEKHMSYLDETHALQTVFAQYDALQLSGGVLRIGDEVVGYTIGECLGQDTYNVHFEKAYAHIRGAYPMVGWQFANFVAQNFPQVRYLNREEDMGIENLRKAKQSYYPDFMVEKYTAQWR